MNQLPILIPLPVLLVALATPIVGRLWRHGSLSLALGATALSTACSAWALAEVIANGTLSYQVGGWAPPLGIELVVDRISAFVALVVTSVSLVTIFATHRWAQREAGDRLPMFYTLVLLLLTGLTGIVVTGDLFNLFVFLEIASLSAYALVFIGGSAGMIAGFRYLILGSVGGAFYLLGVGFIYFATGTLNMADAKEILTDPALPRAAQAGAIFIFTGLGLKMALVPLHLWLPDAYTHAPSSVNTVIAPVMTKVMAYAMLRMFLSVFPNGYLNDVVPIGDLLLVLGSIGVVLGSLAAISQTDFRRMLAYSSIGQIGLIAVGIGLATPLAMAAAVLHILNHAVMKSGLFLVAANVRMRTGSSTLDGFVGVGRTMPLTMASFVLLGLAMVGVPPLVGFFSKFYLAEAAIGTGNWAIFAIVLLSGLLSAAYMFRVIERAYMTPLTTGVNGKDPNAAGDGRPDVILPILFLAIATLALGLLNGAVLTDVLEPATMMVKDR